MNEQLAIDRILETENLTDELEDDDADWLIHWGIDKVHDLLAGMEDDETAGAKVNELMDVMRQLNRIVAHRAVKSPEDLAEEIGAFLRQYTQTFSLTQPGGDIKTISGSIAHLSAREAMQRLIALVE